MATTKEQQKQRALELMAKIGFDSKIIDKFEETEQYMMSTSKLTLTYVPDELKERIDAMCEKYNMYPYHIIHADTNFGNLYSIIYVSDCKEEWYMDLQLISVGRLYSYTLNYEDDIMSDFGSIGYRKFNDTILVRTS